MPDRAMSNSVRRLDMVVCRILSDGQRPSVMMPPLRVSRLQRKALLAAFADDDPHDIAVFFGPRPPPALENSDGHTMTFCTEEYRVSKANATQAWRRQSERLTETGSDHLDWLSAESTVLGTVSRNGLMWTLETNSAERMRELVALVLEAAPQATQVSWSNEPAAEKFATQPPPRHLRAVPDIEAQEAIRAYIAEYEEKWIDERIPALDDRTPRECVSAGGKALAELKALLDDFESMGDDGMSAHRLRALLGMSDT
jgi:hypothetical protein